MKHLPIVLTFIFAGLAFAGGAITSDPVQVQKAQIMTENAQAADKVVAIFMEPYNIFLLIFLICLGATFKKMEKFPDWAILPALIAMGGVGGWVILTKTYMIFPSATAVMLGIIDGILAGSAHQILKQLFESPFGVALLQIPGVIVIAGLLGVAPEPAPPVPVTPPAK